MTMLVKTQIGNDERSNDMTSANQKKPSWIASSQVLHGLLRNKPIVKSFIIGATLLPLISSQVFALPTLMSTPTGNVRYSTGWSPTGQRVMNINTSGEKAILNSSSFIVLPNELVKFNLPNSNSSILNNVLPILPTYIYGQIQSNGGVILSNSAGTYIAPSARINAQALTVSSYYMPNQSYLSGNYSFSRSSDYTGSILNMGNITTGDGGFVLMLGPNVYNAGNIVAPNGNITLAVGDKATAQVSDNVLVDFQVTEGLKQSYHWYADAITNTGTLQANGGLVQLKADLLSGIYSSAVNNSGRIIANATEANSGAVSLIAVDHDNNNLGNNRGTIYTTGLIDTSGDEEGQAGGSVEMQGQNIALLGHAKIDASGQAGGGAVQIGGTYDEEGNPIATANNTVMAPDTSILTTSLSDGPGGDVLLASKNYTGFFGDINADGANDSTFDGRAGRVDIRSNNQLLLLGTISAIDGTGRGGGAGGTTPWTLTLDNTTANGAFNNGSPNVFTQTLNGSHANITNIKNSLNAGTSVTINTKAGQLSDIIVAGAISKTSGAAATLTLNASNDIKVNSTISSTSNALNVAMNAGHDIIVTPTTAGAIQSNGGSVSLNAANNINLSGTNTQVAIKSANGAVNLTSNNLAVASKIDAGTGTVTIKPYTASQAIQIGTGAVDNATTLGVTNTEMVNIKANTLAIGSTTSTGDITLTGNINAADVNNINALDLKTAGNIALGSNAIQMDASTTSQAKSLLLGVYGQNSTINQTLPATPAFALTAKNLSLISQGGAVTLLGANITPFLTVATKGASVSLRTSKQLSIASANLNGNGTTSSGNLTLNTPSGVIQSGDVTGVNTLDVTYDSGAVTLTRTTNNFANLKLSGTGANSAQAVTSGPLNISGINLNTDNNASTGSANITAGGNITQSAAITGVTNLGLISKTGSVALTNTGNRVGAISVQTSGKDFTYNSCPTCAVTLGSINLNSGLTTAATGNLSVSAGAITQNSSIVGINLFTAVSGAGIIGINNTSNSVNSVNLSTADGNAGFTNSKGFTVTGINLNTDNDTVKGNLTLKAMTGRVTVTGPITGTGTVTITPAP